MKLEKIIIDGKEYYRKVEKEDIYNDEYVIIDDNAESSSGDKKSENKTKSDTQIFFEKVGNSAKDIGIKIVDGTKIIGKKIGDGAKELGTKIKEGTERLFNKDKSCDPDSTEAKLLRLLPYMSREDAHEVCVKLLESDELMKKINVADIMPFVSNADCDALFLRGLALGNMESDMAKAIPYVSQECLSSVVDGYIAGKYPELDIDSLYPFLSDADIKKIFYYIINSKPKNA